MENRLIDHDHLIRLDKENAYDKLLQLVEQNGAEVVIFDTAYKFLGGDIESSAALSRAFEVLDKVIHETGVSMVMTHHLRKSAGGKGKENTDVADPDGVAGSFLWTGWPNDFPPFGDWCDYHHPEATRSDRCLNPDVRETHSYRYSRPRGRRRATASAVIGSGDRHLRRLHAAPRVAIRTSHSNVLSEI